MRLYTVDGTLITGAWGEDPSVAGAGLPYLDVGTTLPSFPTPVVLKSSVIVSNWPPTGTSLGDMLEYTISIENRGLTAIGNLIVLDSAPVALTYVASSSTKDGVAVADNGSGTPFPFDAPGYTIPVIPRNGSVVLRYRAVITASGNIINTVATSIPGVIYTNTVIAVPVGPVIPCTLTFALSDGTPVTSYNPGAGIYVKITDANANTNTSTIQSLTVLVQNTSNGDAESLVLTETSANSGIFLNSSALPSSTTAGLTTMDGTLNV